MNKMLVIGFDMNKLKFKEDIVEIENSKNRLQTYYKLIDCDCIDIVNLTEDIAVIVDDEGLLKSGNPVFEVKYKDRTLQLAGTMIFAKNVYTSEGIDLTGFDNLDICDLLLDLRVKMIGVTA